MSIECAPISVEEQRHALLLTARRQVDEETVLKSGSVLPPGSIPDHISFGGVPIFFPGILDDYDAQGGERWGHLPCLDDHFYFVHMAACYAKATGGTDFLGEEINGRTLLARLESAYAMPPARGDNGLVSVERRNRGVNFGFFDTTVHTGDLLFCSLLKWRAAGQLARLLEQAGDPGAAARYRADQDRIARAVPETFQQAEGWLRASTGLSSQPDVWGTAFACHLGLLPGDAEHDAREALVFALRHGTIAWEGGIRHVPTNHDFNEETAWEVSYARKNTYQNGAYWPTPTGWVCRAVAPADEALARDLAAEYIAALRAGDFRRGEAFGAPWECRHPEGGHAQNPVYLTSVSEPRAAILYDD
jgi:glycogen debranching enzyme